MNVATLQQTSTKTAFYNNYFQPNFFDEPIPIKARKKEFCKVYNDGGHFVAVPLKPKRESADYYIQKKKDPLRAVFDELYSIAQADGKNETQTRAFLQDNLSHLFEEETELNAFIETNIKRRLHNLHSRRKRAHRKASLNKWSYFITITYDDKKHTETEFKTKLRKCLSNLHTRHNWKYMGVFERAPKTGRLHFHALLYVPAGELVGDIVEKQDYSTKKHRMQIYHENTFFEKTFGRNDFEEIKPVMRNECIGYIMKYMEKTGERIIYSRGIPAEIYTKIDKDDIILTIRNFIMKYVLFDDVISWENDIKDYTAPQIRGYEPRYTYIS